MTDRLDSDLLRTFLAIAEAGSFTAGASAIGRTQSAASLQIKRLESVLGQRVFDRHGRGVGLTEAGTRLLPVARRVAGTLDAALSDIRDGGLAGRLRIGLPDDDGAAPLARAVAEFSRRHPKVELTVHCALSAGFPEALRRARLDMAVHAVETPTPDMAPLRRERMVWLASADHDAATREPLPVAIFDRACWWRDAAVRSLEARGITHRVVYESESIAGVLAAVRAGIAVAFLGETAQAPGLSIPARLRDGAEAATSTLVLQHRQGPMDDVARAMAEAITRAYGAPVT